MRALAILAAVAMLVAGSMTIAREQPESGGPKRPEMWRPADWSAAAVGDIEASYRLLRDSHPGMLDAANPDFPAALDRARADALAFAARVRDAPGFAAALGVFQADLRDGHAGPFDNLPAALAAPVRWPGFVTAWRGDGLYVYASEPGGPPRGARVVSCDGVSIARLARVNVFRFAGRPSEAGEWWVRARRVLTDLGNPFVRPPRSCSIVVDGHARAVDLVWRADTEQARAWRTRSYNGDALPVGLTAPRRGLMWIAMPTFDPEPPDVARYHALYAALAARRSALRGARAIVLDLRQNQGGSSDWSLRVARALWGGTTVDEAMRRYEAAERVRWRATPGNLAALRDEVNTMRADGDPDGARERAAIVDGMTRSLAEGKSVYEEPAGASAARAGAPPARATLRTPVYVIVPGQCASACLDALDVFTRFANTTLIGAPSSGDTSYIDVRQETLPSTLATIVMPMKAIAGRPRRPGETYRPRIVVTDLDWSTAGFIHAIERDLATRSRRIARPSPNARPARS